MRVLIIDSNLESRSAVSRICKSERFIVDTAASGLEGIEFAGLYDYDLMMLEPVLPDVSGAELVKRLRSLKVRTPLLALARILDTDEGVYAATIGTDGCIAMQSSPSRVVARLYETLCKAARHSSTTVVSGRLKVDLVSRQVSLAGAPLHLTPKEYQVLRILVLAGNRPVTRADILDRIYEDDADTELRTVDVVVSRLRKKLARGSRGLEYIDTLKGSGYRFSGEHKASHTPLYA